MVQKLWQVLIMQNHTVHQSLYNFNAAAGNDLKILAPLDSFSSNNTATCISTFIGEIV